MSHYNIVEVWRDKYSVGDRIHQDLVIDVLDGGIIASVEDIEQVVGKRKDATGHVKVNQEFYLYTFFIVNSGGLFNMQDAYTAYEMFAQKQAEVIAAIDRHMTGGEHDELLLLYSCTGYEIITDYGTGTDYDVTWEFEGVLSTDLLKNALVKEEVEHDPSA
jgi:hypothetical protein